MELIVAVSREWGIGCGGRLLFSIPEDLRAFRERTHGGVVIMGRATLDSLPGGRALEGRRNIVLSRTLMPRADVELADSAQAVFRLLRGETRPVFVIGGARVYRAFLPYCYRAWVTRVEATPTADRFCPDLSCTPGWSLEAAGPTLHSGPLAYRFLRYRNERVEAAR